jgi:hypothetical protein
LDTVFDMVHIDGDHVAGVIHREIDETVGRLSHNNTRFVFDDYDMGTKEAISNNSHRLDIMYIPICKWRSCLVARKDRTVEPSKTTTHGLSCARPNAD